MRRMILAMVLAVAACESLPGGTRSGDLPATRMRSEGGVVVPPGRGDTSLAVRSFVQAPDGEAIETAGATCRLATGDLRAAVVTPARLVLPDLGPDALPIRADCALGTARGAAEAPPYFRWQATDGTRAQRTIRQGGQFWGGPRTGPMAYPDLLVGLR